MDVRSQANYRAKEGKKRVRVVSIFFFIYLHSMLTCARCTLVYMFMCMNKADKSTSKQHIIVYICLSITCTFLFIAQLLSSSSSSSSAFFSKHIHVLIEVHVVSQTLAEYVIKFSFILSSSIPNNCGELIDLNIIDYRQKLEVIVIIFPYTYRFFSVILIYNRTRAPKKKKKKKRMTAEHTLRKSERITLLPLSLSRALRCCSHFQVFAFKQNRSLLPRHCTPFLLPLIDARAYTHTSSSSILFLLQADLYLL